MDRAVMEANVQRWKRYLPLTEMHYAVKVNSDPLVLQLIKSLGCSFDTASTFEMNLVAAIGAGGDRMILSHPAKDTATLKRRQRVGPLSA